MARLFDRYSDYRWFHYLAYISVFLQGFFVSAVFRHRQFDGGSLDFQVMLKLGVFAIGFATSILLINSWFGRLKRLDHISLLLLVLWIFFSTTYAPSMIYSLACAITFVAVLATMYMAAQVIGTKATLDAIIWSCFLLCIISIIVYYVNPSFGRMSYWNSDGVRAPSSRLSGITSTANSIGYIAALGCMLIFCCRIYILDKLTFPKYYYFFFLVCLIALLMSDSRTPLAASILAVGFCYYMHRISYLRLFLACSGILSIILIVSFVDLSDFLVLLSRSGNLEEITTGTGRTEIWQEVIDMIAANPIFGYGFASSAYYMPDFDHSSPHAHNFILQVFFSIGIIGFFLVLYSFIIKIYYSILFHDRIKMTLIIFFLIHGLSEAPAFHNIATTATLVFCMIFALDYTDMRDRDNIRAS